MNRRFESIRRSAAPAPNLVNAKTAFGRFRQPTSTGGFGRPTTCCRVRSWPYCGGLTTWRFRPRDYTARRGGGRLSKWRRSPAVMIAIA